MFKEVQSSFVALGNGNDPATIPPHYAKTYDEALKMFGKFGHYCQPSRIHENFWPLICLIADMGKRIDELESAMAARQLPGLPRYDSNGDLVSLDEPKKHWKTRQAEERKAALTGA